MVKHTKDVKDTVGAFYDDGIAHFPIRLEELIGNESLRSFGRNVGISDSGLRKYLPPGSSRPTFDKLVAIARYKGVNLEWLATGKGSKSGDVSPNALDCRCNMPSDGGDYVDANFLDEEFVLVPGYHVQVSAGSGCTPLQDNPKVRRHLAFRKKWIQHKNLNPKSLCVVFAKGDSMADTIKDNDSLLVDLSSTTPVDGRVFVVRLGDELYAKRIQVGLLGELTLISDNSSYKAIEIAKENLNQLVIIGRVVQISTEV